MAASWWQRRRTLARRAKPARRPALSLERLEDRTVPSFSGPLALALPAAPQAVATGNFEGANAPPDVVTADANGVLSVFLTRSDGTLPNPINIHVGGSPTSVATGDFLGNGLQDIVAANSNGTANIVLSNGNGTFQAPRVVNIGATPVAVAVGDFFGNGQQEIVTANSNGTLSVFSGNGSNQTPIVTTIGDSFRSIAVGDFNNDGKADLVVGTSTGLDVLTGNGNGTFQLMQTVPFSINEGGNKIPVAVTSVAVGRPKAGAPQDIVALANSSVSILVGNGNGTFQPQVSLNTGGTIVQSFAIGDFTGHGKLDVVTSNASGYPSGAPSLSVLAGNGDNTFQAPNILEVGESATALVAADFNGDGKLDLALASSSGINSLTTLLNKGGGTFNTTPLAPANVLPSAMAAGDFNHDGKQDLVVTGIGGNAVVLLSNGDGTFTVGPTLTVSGSPDAVAVGDFLGNGKQDIAVGTESGTIDVFLGNGNGTFQAPRVINLGSNMDIRDMVSADFNHDGRADLAVTSMLQDGNETGVVTVLTSNGNGTFRITSSTKVGVDAEGLAVGDLNGDGKPDLVTTTFLPDGSRDVKVLLGNGNGTFQTPRVVTPGTSATFVGVGNLINGGKPDLVLVDYFHDTVTVVPGNGNGTFGSPITTAIPSAPGALLGGPAIGDFFGDGNISVAVTSGVGTVSVLRGNGDGTFQAPIGYLMGFHGSQPSTVIAADFNGDGKPDLAATDALAEDISAIINTTPAPVHQAPVATTTSLAVDTKTAVFGQPVTLTATVTAPGMTPTGTVTFRDGNTVLAQVALDPSGQASFTVPFGVGTQSLTATFTGLAPFTNSTSAAVSVPVSKAATTNLLSVQPLTSNNEVVILTATIAPMAPGVGVPTGTVTFFDGSTVVGTAQVSSGQASLFVAGLTPGKHKLTAVYRGDSNFDSSTSAVFILNVT
jgi:hypothetical protein